MKIVHINSADSAGGAAKAAYRLHIGLRALGQDSSMFVAQWRMQEPGVLVFRPPTDPLSRCLRITRRLRLRWEIARYANSRPPYATTFTDDRSEHGIRPLRELPRSDIVHLHWVAGLVDYGTFLPEASQHAPLVWTLHDMNAFTGGCHYNGGCDRFSEGCGRCPELGSAREDDLSRRIWKRKNRAYSAVAQNRLHVVAPSQWLAGKVRRSTLMGRFPVSVIPNGVDVNRFAPRDRNFARDVLGVRRDAKLVAFVSQWFHDRRKGLPALVEALNGLRSVPNLQLVTVGHGDVSKRLNIPCVALDYVVDERFLTLVYSAADIFVNPTLEDNLPNTVLESIACAVPVVGFRTGGMPDIVRQGITGLLVSSGDTRALREAIEQLLCNTALRAEMAAKCRRAAVEEYALEVQARRYISLYEMMLARN